MHIQLDIPLPQIGARYGSYTVYSDAVLNQGYSKKWHVQCVCGTVGFVNASRLRCGRAIMCSKCAAKSRMGSKYKPIIGTIYGNYEVIDDKVYQPDNAKSAYFKVKCLLCNVEYLRYAKKLVSGIYKQCRSCGTKLKQKNDYLPIGSKYGYFTVIEGDHHKFNNAQHQLIHVQCDCGYIGYTARYNLTRGKATHCKGCTSIFRKKNYKSLGGSYISSIRNGARSRHLEYNVTPKFLWELFEKQKGICALSGVQIELSDEWGNKKKSDRSQQTASLDRIDSSRGYTEDNVQWVHKTINNMKMQTSEEEFIHWCNIISAYNKNNKKNV